MRYLLGTLSEEERAQLEERYFSDDAEFEEIEVAEGELVDRYVRDELAQPDRARFEQMLAASPRLIERVEFARLFADKLRVAEDAVTSRTPAPVPERRSWFSFFDTSGSRLVPAFSVLLVLLAGGGLLVGWWQLRQESRRLAVQQAALEQRQRELEKQASDLKAQSNELAKHNQPNPSEAPLPAQVPQETPTKSGATLAFVTLTPGTTRSGSGSKLLRILPGTAEVQLTLNLRDTDYSSYRVAVVNAGQKEVFSKSGIKARTSRSGAVLVFRVPAGRLPQDDYYVSLYGEPANESLAEYPFRIIK